MFIAHRGNDNHDYRENSEEAILFCLQQQYLDGIECDLRLTRDNKIVLSHNSLIDFISNGSGFIYNMSLKELLQYDFKNGKITELNSLLTKINSNKILLLEIKEERSGKEKEWFESLEPILKKYTNLKIYICSFNYNLLKKLKNIFPEFYMGLIIGYTINQKKSVSDFDFIMYHYKSLRYTHKKSMIWTLNNKDDIYRYRNKVDYIITDNAYKFV